MAGVVLLRADDHLVLGVRWSGFTVTGTGAGARLTAGAQARITIVLPPQHIGEETSPPASSAPLQLPADGSGATVPAWRGVLSAASRLTFKVEAGTQIALTAEGVLAAVMNNPLLAAVGVPGPDDTAIELPWRLVIAPRGRSGAGTVVCRHPIAPVSAASSGLWRTRLVNPTAAADATLLDADLTLTVVDQAIAGAADPAFGPNNAIPLRQQERLRLFTETGNQPARVTRLELSALGGSLDAAARFANFEWEHHAVLGRDMYVRTLAKGVMYPLGHRAEFLKVAERTYDTAAGGAAVLRFVNVLSIVDRVRAAPRDGPVRRGFPMGDVEITRARFTDLAPPVWQTTVLPVVGAMQTHFWPTTLDGSKVRFPAACATSSGVINLDLPMLFVADLRPAVDSLSDTGLLQRLATDYGGAAIPVGPVNLDLVGAAAVQRASGDMHEVHSITVAGATEGLDLTDGYRAKIAVLEVALPALRALRGEDVRTNVAFAGDYLRNGAAEDVLLEMLPRQGIPIDFTGAADRSGGLVAPKYVTNAISRTLGPIDLSSRPDPATGFIDPQRLFPTDEAALLGFPLRSLLTGLKNPPEITANPIAGSAPEVRMRWQDVKVQSVGPFIAKPTTRLNLTITTAPNTADTNCVLNDFALELPPGPARSLRLSFATMQFSQHDGKSPRLEVGGVDIEFLGELRLLEELGHAIDLGAADKLINVNPSGITLRHSLPIPSITAGPSFVLRNVVFTARIELPFDGRPVSVVIGFASRPCPFALSVMMFGGGGYVELALDRDGLNRFEAALEFGAFVAIDFLIASGEVHALGGVRFVLEQGGEVTVTGYLRIGGCVEVLGLISVSIELCLSLSYRSERNALVGRATLVIEIDLTLWSESVEIDSGEWVLAGNSSVRHRALGFESAASPMRDALSQWRDYRAAFVDEDASALAIARALQDGAPAARRRPGAAAMTEQPARPGDRRHP